MSTFSDLASLPEGQFTCPICLNVFSDPVTTPCGHNFCNSCLSRHWEHSELCCCPTCNKRFYARPEFSTNTVMAEISAQIKRRKVETLETAEAPWRVKCDVCVASKMKASRSCLVCLTSYCEAHLESHRRVPSLMRHKLIEPLENLEERICEKHERLLEFFCRDEQACVCLLCCETDHKDHDTVPVEKEGARQKKNIESKKAQIKVMIEGRMEKIKAFTDSSEMRKEKVNREIEFSDELFRTLMNKLEEMHTKLISNINKKLLKSQDKDEAMIGELREEIAELQRKDSQLEELAQSEDHLQLLQSLQALSSISDTKDWSRIQVYSELCVQTVRRAMGHLVHSFQAELKALIDTELSRMRRYKESVTFDPSNAGSRLAVTESGTRLKYYKIARSPFLEDSNRFTYPMVLGTKGFTSGRHYWEVQVGRRNDWDVGVAKETVKRKEKVPVVKENGFFAIGKEGFDYKVHRKPDTVLHLCPRPRYVGVYLDYEAGRVSFYDVNEKRHIYSFKGESFTEKLFPYFYLHSGAKKSEPLLIRNVSNSLPFSWTSSLTS
ncbi:E3 ubiquitin-protein ligase TRIM39-like isoform X1 [Embiotoca jacksoni]|uniref:E3 ubiquitin-protein ligase TRIM39-like isoform X1 n=1 Tax=Embiotoca jacksoni TaxID=100190 RepID=UPI0037044A0B